MALKALLLIFGVVLAADYLRPVRRSTAVPPADWEQNARALLAPGRRIVAVAAHPDDVEFYIGGTVARLSAHASPVSVILGTDGNKSRYYPGFLSRRLANTRRREQQASGKVLGYDEITFLGHPDGRLAEHAEMVGEVAARLKALKPGIVLTFDSTHLWGIQHPDHRAAGRFALEAVRKSGLSPELFFFATRQPNTWVDVSDTIARKWDALRAHASQFGPFRFWMIRGKLLQPTAEWEGEKIGARYAEVFRRAREE